MEKLAKAGEERLQALKGINNDAKRTLKPNGLADRLDHAIYGLYSFVEHGVKTKKFGTQKQLQKAL